MAVTTPTVSELIKRYNEVMDIILGFGTDVPQILSEIQSIRDSTNRIVGIVKKHLGFSAPRPVMLDQAELHELFHDPQIQDKEQKLLSKAQPHDPNRVVGAADVGYSAAPTGVAAPINLGSLRDILLYVIQHPELLTFILALFKGKKLA